MNKQFAGTRQISRKEINDLELKIRLREDDLKEIETGHKKLFEEIKLYETALEMTHVDCPEKIKEKEKIALELENANQELDEPKKI